MSDSEAQQSTDTGPVAGDRLTATIVAIDSEQIRVDLGNAVTSKLADPDFELLSATEAKVGDEIDVFVEHSREKPYDLIASTIKADKLRLWDTLIRAAESDEVIEGEVVAKIRGGLSVDIGVRAFLPASQLELRPVDDLDSYIGKRFPLNIIKFNKKRGNIVLSRRQILEADREGLKAATLRKLVEGEVVTGHVKNFTQYGAFIDIGGVDGLVHVDDLSWGRVKHPGDVLKVGQEIRVKVLKFDADKERISLGYKQLLPDPWEGIEDRYPIGKKISGPVQSLTDYGAFVELEPGLDGLVHVSELSWKKRVQHPRELLRRGEQVEAIVLELDFNQRRISLGIKQTLENPWVAFREQVADGATVKGVVSGVKDFGFFVELENGLEGLVHVSDISWERVRDPSEHYKKGDEVEVKILDINVDSERLSLGIKQLSEDPWAAAQKRFPTGTKFSGKVTKVMDFGAFIELEPGIEGLCHISQLSTDRVDKTSDVAKVGNELEVVVIDFNKNKQRVSLSVKALTAAGGDDYRSYMNDIPEDGTPFGNALGVALADKIKKDAGDSDSD